MATAKVGKARKNIIAGQIGEHLVCAALGRQGYVATAFSGNVPVFDVLATDEACNTVPIQVKASRGDTWRSSADTWMEISFLEKRQRVIGPTLLKQPKLIWVFVSIADGSKTRDRFFVLTGKQLQQVTIASYMSFLESKNGQRPRTWDTTAHRWFIKDFEQFENNWTLITDQLNPVV